MSKQIPTVRMKHPGVKTEADVPTSAVPIHEKAGWTLVQPVAKTPAADKPAPVKPVKQEKEDG